MYYRDLYLLKESDPCIVKEREEITIDLFLVKVPPSYHTFLTGRITCHYYPIWNATVRILDDSGKYLDQTNSDVNGIYKICNHIRPGICHVMVSAKGYHTIEKRVYVTTNNITCLSFQLHRNPMYHNGLLYGDILEYGCEIPVENAAVNLMPTRYCYNVEYKTHSNYSGNYMIYDIVPGYYNLIVQKQGYQIYREDNVYIDNFDTRSINVHLCHKETE